MGLVRNNNSSIITMTQMLHIIDLEAMQIISRITPDWYPQTNLQLQLD